MFNIIITFVLGNVVFVTLIIILCCIVDHSQKLEKAAAMMCNDYDLLRVKDGIIFGIILFFAERITILLFASIYQIAGFEPYLINQLCDMLSLSPIIYLINYLWRKRFAFAFSLILVSQLLIRLTNVLF